AALPSRREALARTLEDAGWRAIAVEPGSRPEGSALALLDVADLAPAEAARRVAELAGGWPVVVVGRVRDMPALLAAIERGAADLAVDPVPEELALRVRRALSARFAGAGRRAESALIELA